MREYGGETRLVLNGIRPERIFSSVSEWNDVQSPFFRRMGSIVTLILGFSSASLRLLASYPRLPPKGSSITMN